MFGITVLHEGGDIIIHTDGLLFSSITDEETTVQGRLLSPSVP